MQHKRNSIEIAGLAYGLEGIRAEGEDHILLGP